MLITLMVVVGLVVLVLLWVVAIYNGLVRQRNEVKNAWAQIDVQLKRRHDLIPNLVETVKGYATHERGTLDAVISARAKAVNTHGVANQAVAEGELSQALGRLMMVVENYPDLKANQNFLALQEELTSTENRIGFARQFYNDSVMKYNTVIESFPQNVVAGSFGFQRAEHFELQDAAQREAPQVKFS
ncbi:MAG: LemA family protein [Phycisphaerales bacterium]|nr:LemA family protein [Phycisphaerales bacterium]